MKLLCVILLLLTVNVNGQDKEFEGVIRYKHSYVFSNIKDTVAVINALGRSSVLYYKKGNYRWVIFGKEAPTEYFDDKTQTCYYLYRDKDSLFQSKKNGFRDSLVQFRKLDRKDTVAGIECSVVETVIISKDLQNTRTKRTLSYSPQVPVPEGRFYNFRTYATNKINPRINSLPLKMELDNPMLGMVMIFEAVEISPQKLEDHEVYLPTHLPIKNFRR